MSTKVSNDHTSWLVPGVCIAFGVMLLVLSAPRFMAHLQIVQAPYGIDDALANGGDIPADQLDLAHERYMAAAGWMPGDSVLQQDLGRLDLRYAANGGVNGANALKTASEHFRLAIAASPSRGFPWSLDAYVQSKLETPITAPSDEIRMSYYLSPHEASSVFLRARVGGAEWDHLPDDVRQIVKRDFAEIWHMTVLRNQLIALYLTSSFEVRGEILKLGPTDPAEMRLFSNQVLRAAKP